VKTEGKSAPVSVVIPTLGGLTVEKTISRLNAGSVVPAEILICIPESEAHRLNEHFHANVRVVATACKGQVGQRAVGFRQASSELVMQLDDDVLLHERCLEYLVQDLASTGSYCAIAPAFIWSESGQSPYEKHVGWFARLFYWGLNGATGYRAGTVTKAGTEIGKTPASGDTRPCAVEWIPGGCVLHRKKDLVLDDYFPFPGKAFCEDLIHSFILTNRKVRLYISSRAVATIDKPLLSIGSTSDSLASLKMECRARRYYVEMAAKSKFRMYLYYLARIARQLLRAP
jgi:hypothetical protein